MGTARASALRHALVLLAGLGWGMTLGWLIAGGAQQGAREQTRVHVAGHIKTAGIVDCREEAALREWRAEAAANLTSWQHSLLPHVLGGFGPFTHSDWARPAFAATVSCPPHRPRTRYGGRQADPGQLSGAPSYQDTADDGSKVLCQLEPVYSHQARQRAHRACVIYSLGSSGNFAFERAMLDQTSCEVHTMDCTYNGTSIQPGRHAYHKWCVGDPAVEGARLRSWDNITRSLGHTRGVDLLKMDIEGYEVPVLAQLQPGMALPSEISLELHGSALLDYNPHMAMPAAQLPHSAAGMALLLAHLANLGYASYNMEVNSYGPDCCAELSFLRVSAAASMQPLAW